MDKIVSIIIPVYNTPLEYLEACFASVRMQKYPLLEPIVVDDGSDELTAKLLERICGQEFKILHKKNGGLSDARNFGIARCSGDYVLLSMAPSSHLLLRRKDRARTSLSAPITMRALRAGRAIRRVGPTGLLTA